jgi:hypothetical protein
LDWNYDSLKQKTHDKVQFDFNRHIKSRKVYRILMGKPGGKRPLGRPRCRWKDGLRMDLREVGWGGGGTVDSVGSGYRPVMGSFKYGDEPAGSGTTELVYQFRIIVKLHTEGLRNILYLSKLHTFFLQPTEYEW